MDKKEPNPKPKTLNPTQRRDGYQMDKKELLNMYDRLVFASMFESFLATE